MQVSAQLSGSLIAGLVVLFGGCRPEPSTTDLRPPDAAMAVDGATVDVDDGCADPGPAADIDFLLVVGSGPRSQATQSALFDNFAALTDQIACVLGTRPNLHVGVVSADLGAGGFAVPRCTGGGGGALLLEAPAVAGCTPADDPYVSDVDDGSGGRARNFEGDFSDAVGCVGRIGADGCAFEQPIEAAVQATAPGNNPGFLRDEALLVILFASGGDDCSVTDNDLFDPDQVPAFGPLSTFRCFEFGVECNPDDPRTPGNKSACAARAAATPLADVAALDAILRSRKSDPAEVLTAYIGGSPGDVSVALNGGSPVLLSSCPLPINAVPPVRINSLNNISAASSCALMPIDVSPIATAIAESAIAR